MNNFNLASDVIKEAKAQTNLNSVSMISTKINYMRYLERGDDNERHD